MSGPVENRSVNELSKVKRLRRSQRKLTKREHQANRMRYVVGWLLAFVFGVTSVGFLINFRQPGTGDTKDVRSQQQVSMDRLHELEKKATETPADENWHFEIAREYAENLRDLDKAAGELKKTLEINPAHLEALHMLATIDLMREKPTDAVKVLQAGMIAEKKDVDRLNREHASPAPAASPRPGAPPEESPEPVPDIQPDATLRAQLFHAYVLMGPAHEAEAHAAAHEGLELQPTDFVNYMRQRMALQMAILGKKEVALRAVRIASDEAKALKLPKAVTDLAELNRMIASIQKSPPMPARTVPAAVASPSAVAPPAASPAPSATPAPTAP